MEKNQQQLIQLPTENLELFDQISPRWDAKIPQGVKPEALLVPSFWAHRAVKLKPCDEIRARAEDGTWVAYYIVTDSSRTWAKVHLLSFHLLTTADVSLTQASETEVKAFIDAHTITWRAQHKWSVVRKADKALVAEGLGKDEAIAWLDKFAREQVGAPTTVRAEPVAA
jgi:hypothetical protein